MLKYAEFQMLAAELAPGATRGLRRAVAHRGSTDIVFDKTAHRADFSHIEKRPGYLYVRSRAISSRCNDNFDEFPAGEIKLGYKTFIGKPAFVNHHNDNHKRARGVIVAAELHEDINPDGSPDTWVEVLHEVDAVKFPKLAAGILAGEIDRTSMGTDCAWSLCSVCGNKAENPSQYCQHIPRLKGKKFIRRNAATGKQEEVLCREICGGLSFFENSFLVEPPADPTAHVLGVESGPGVAKAASLVHEAASDGLATRYRCRSGQGIMCDRGDGKPTRKKCSYCGSPFMVERGLHGVFHHNPKSVYREHEALSTHTNRAKAQAAADKVDDGVVRWIYKDNPSTTGSLHTAGTISCPECGLYEFDENDELLPRTPGPGCWYCHERGVVDTDQKLPNIWENHTVQDLLDSKTSSLQKTSSLDEEFAALMKLATQPSSVSDHVAEPEWETSTAADLCKTCGWPVERGPNGWTHEEKNPVQWSDRRKQGSLSTLSYGEVMAPPKVDTLRDPECPICQSDSYDGQRCPTCLFVKPPDDFMDPNLEMARQVDLRQEQQGQAINDLSCDSCGNEFSSEPYQATAPGAPGAESSPLEPMQRMEKPDPMAPGAEDVAGENDQPFLTDEEEDGTKERAQDGKDQKPQDEADGVGGEDDEEDKPFITDEDAGKDTDRRIETEVDDSAKDEQKAENELADDHPADAQTHIDEAEKDLANSEQVPGESGDEGQIGTNPKEGDTCPVCSKGILRKKDQVSGTPKDPADEGSDEDKDENGDDKNPFASKDDSKKDKSDSDKKTSAVRPRHSHGEGTDVTMRPALAALNEQQKMIVAQRRQIAALREGFRWMSTMAGLGGHPKVAQILHYADENNPGQPVPTPAAEAPSVTTDEARAPDGMTDVTQIGESPVNDVAADAVEGVGQPYQTVLDEPLDLNEQDVTAPVAGTEGPLPTDQVITEVDVQTGGDRINDATEAFPWEMGPTTGAARQASTPARQGGRNRTMACLRLARLRIAVGTAHIADDLSLAAEIEGSDLPDESIDTEISTLDAVSKVQTQGSRQPVARNLVPRAANRVQRAAPSLGREDNGLSMVASGGSDDDSFLFE